LQKKIFKKMRTYLDCLPCIMNQTIRTARLATENEEEIREIFINVGAKLKEFDMSVPPPLSSEFLYREVSRVTGVLDPYRQIKKANIAEALALYPELKKIVQQSDNPLLTAARIAIAGNVIDLGMSKKFDIKQDVYKILQQDFGIDHFNKLETALKNAKIVLYLGDNSGESVFDKILMEEINAKIYFAVREKPIINDVTRQEAIESGIDQVAEIVSSGCTAPATILSQCNSQFLELFEQADVVISKGQGNYEGLSDANRSVFFLLKAKCHVIARDLNVNENDIVLKCIHC